MKLCALVALVVGLAAGAAPAAAAYPGTNGKIAFISYRDGNSEIYAMNPDGSEQTNLTNHPAYDSAPGWSPDGSKIAFVSERDGDFEVYVMNADGSGPTNLTNDPTFFDEWPNWQPLVDSVAALGPVGGIAEIEDLSGAPLQSRDPSDISVEILAALLAGVTASALALGGAAWYARRRWLR